MKIELSHVSKEFRGVPVLQDISLTFTNSNIYGIVGTNGCGKTMLLRAIAGLLIPSNGTICVDGKLLQKDISFPSEMGILIENPSFINYLSGFENLHLLAQPKKLCPDTRIQELLTDFKLNGKEKMPVKKYSLGMKQKLGIIQAIMEDPVLLILDEPFNALDEKTVLYVQDLLLKFKEQGKLIIITSHHKEDIDKLCDVIIKMADGEISSVEYKEFNAL